MYKLSKTNVSNLIVNSSIDCLTNVKKRTARCTRANAGYKTEARVCGGQSRDKTASMCTANQCQEPVPRITVIVVILKYIN